MHKFKLISIILAPILCEQKCKHQEFYCQVGLIFLLSYWFVIEIHSAPLRLSGYKQSNIKKHTTRLYILNR